MTDPDPDPQAAALARLGHRIRALERRENEALFSEIPSATEVPPDAIGASTPPTGQLVPLPNTPHRRVAHLRPRRRREADACRPRRGKIGPLLAALLIAASLVVALLELVSPAGASSPVNRAPTEATKAGSVNFESHLSASLNGQLLATFSESGALGFRTHEFAATLAIGERGEVIERRSLEHVSYFRARDRHEVSAVRARWNAVRAASSSEAPGGEGRFLIDPQVVLGVLAAARAKPTVVGHQMIDHLPTTHYRLSVPLSAFTAADHLALLTSPAAENRVDGSLDVWLDTLGRPTRVLATFAGQSRHGPVVLTIGANFRRYGAPVAISRPFPATPPHARGTASGRVLGGDPTGALLVFLFAGGPQRAP